MATKLLRIEEACERLGVKRTTLYELVRSGELESVRVRHASRIPEDALEDYIARLRGHERA